MRKILVIKPSSFGDIIHALPVATALIRQVPGAIIDWVARPEYEELLKGHSGIRKIFFFDRQRWSKTSNIFQTLPESVGLIRSIRKEKYDTVLDIQGLFRSGLIAYLSGSRWRFGFENARELASMFYNRKVKVPTMQMHAIDRYQLFLKELGLEVPEPDYNLKLPANANHYLDELLSKEGIHKDKALVVLNPNTRWETKRWLPDRFAKLADRLVGEWGAEVVLVGGESDSDGVRSIEKQAKSSLHNLVGKTTIIQLAALLKRADLMVTCDSGPMHLAAAVGTRVLALFGPTDPVRTGPYGSNHRVLQKSMDCVPCLKRSCSEEKHSCMEEIKVDDVLREAQVFLADIQARKNPVV